MKTPETSENTMQDLFTVQLDPTQAINHTESSWLVSVDMFCPVFFSFYCSLDFLY